MIKAIRTLRDSIPAALPVDEFDYPWVSSSKDDGLNMRGKAYWKHQTAHIRLSQPESTRNPKWPLPPNLGAPGNPKDVSVTLMTKAAVVGSIDHLIGIVDFEAQILEMCKLDQVSTSQGLKTEVFCGTFCDMKAFQRR